MENEPSLQRLKSQGYRITPQRRAVLQALAEAEGHLSPADVYQRVAQRLPGVTESTIYRTLEFLASQGLAFAAHFGGGHLTYEDAGHSHHHLYCRDCGGSVEIDDSLLQSLYAEFQKRTGFEIHSSHMVFIGRCPDCREPDLEGTSRLPEEGEM